jgi:hypothetical protein
VPGLFGHFIQLYPGGQFYCWKKQEYQEKTTDLSQFTVVSSTPRLNGIQTHNFVIHLEFFVELRSVVAGKFYFDRTSQF